MKFIIKIFPLLSRLAFEFPAVGGILPSQTLTSVKLLKYTSPEDYVLMAAEFIFIIYILYYIIEETIEIKMHGFKYFTNIWNILDICVIFVSTVLRIKSLNNITTFNYDIFLQISLAQIGLNLYNILKISGLLQALLQKPFLHADFSPLANAARTLTILSAFNVLVAWIKVFKYLSFNKTMTQLSETLSSVSIL